VPRPLGAPYTRHTPCVAVTRRTSEEDGRALLHRSRRPLLAVRGDPRVPVRPVPAARPVPDARDERL